MKIYAVRSAKSIWLLPTYFLNPKGIFLLPAVELLKARYMFARTSPDVSGDDKSLKFEHGAFKSTNGNVEILSMTIHGDGIVVETRSSTDDGDQFLEDVISWVSQEFGLPISSELPFKKIYASELNVEFLRLPALLNPEFTYFFDSVSSAIANEHTGKAQLLQLTLGTDQTRTKSPPTFIIAREIDTPIEAKRFYSFSPTKTDIHISLLEKLEPLSI